MKNITPNILLLLTPKNFVEYLYSDFTVRQAIEKMREKRYSMIPVIERETGKYCYSLREGDFLYYLAENHLSFKALEQCPLSSIPPSREIKAIGISEDIHSLYDRMLDQNFAPVIDDQGVFIGIVTRKKVMNALLPEKNFSL